MTKQRSAAPTQEANGTWVFVVDLGPGVDSKGVWRERRQARRRGFATKKAAQHVMDELRVAARQGTFVAHQRQTVKSYLELDWLPAVKRQLVESTFESYARNVRVHIVPGIGGIQMQALDGAALNRLYTSLLETGNKRDNEPGRLSARTVRYLHTIIGKALKDAVRARLVQLNAAEQATPPSAKSAKPPEMQTWTGPQLAEFLRLTAGDRFGTPGTSSPPPGAAAVRRSGFAGPMWISSRARRRSASRSSCSPGSPARAARAASCRGPRAVTPG
jgi:hypothetical protein